MATATAPTSGGYVNAQGTYVSAGIGSNPYQTSNNPTSSGSTYTPPSPSTSSSSGSIASPYVVVTSGAATSNFNNAQQDYNQNIAPRMQTSQSNQQAQNQLPVISGYNVSATPTGNQGETKATNQATGGTYYITPQNQAPTANDIKNILGGDTSSNNAPTGTTAPAGGSTAQTPTQIATAQTGTNPTTENANFQNQVSGVNDDITNAYNTFTNTVRSIMSGAFPLTGAQQALVDATNQAFQQMNTQAQLKAAALSSETGGVSDKVNATAGELLNITSQQSAAIAKLEIGFQDKNYQMVTDSYNQFKDLEKSKLDSITSIHNTVMDTYNKALTAAQAQQTFNQTVFKDAQTLKQSQYEFRDLKDAFGNTIGTQVFDKATGTPVSNHYAAGQTDPTTGNTTPVVATDPNTGAADPKSQQAYLQTIPAPYRAMVQGIANGNIAPPSASGKGRQILSWVAGYDPGLSDGTGGFDATKYAARNSLKTSLASDSPTSMGGALKTANTVIAHLASFLNTASSIPGKGAVNILGSNNLAGHVISGVEAMFGNNSGQSAESQAGTVSTGLTDEMTKFFKGTGGTDVASIESWGKSLDPNASAGTLQGAVQGGLTLFSGQLNSFIGQYTSVMGHAPDLNTILNPQTVQTLSAFKNAGYKVDVPGIYYTDKNAYLANGGSEQNLTSAYTTLQQEGIPTTPDNVLQAAQILNQ